MTSRSTRRAWRRYYRFLRRIRSSAFLALFEPGDRVALANPGYPPYRHILSALGCEPVLIETSAETRWALSAKALIAEHRKKPLAA